MGVGSKWWLGMLLLFVFVTILCKSAEGSFVTANTTSQINTLVKQSPTAASLGATWNFMKTMFTWNYAVLNQTTLGQIIKMFLTIVSLAVFIPVGYEILRYLNPFKS